MKNYLKLICILFSVVMSSCIKDGYDYDNCPGEYNVTTVWPGNNGEYDGYDENTTLTIITPSGQVITIAPGSSLGLEEGKHQVNGILGNDDDKVEINGSTVTVKPETDGTAGDPGDFMGGSTNIEVTPDGDTSFKVPMMHQSRPLVIKVKFIGYGAEALTGVSGMVEGIALSRHINHGFVPVDGQPRHAALKTGNVSYSAMSINEDGFYTDNKRLLGIDGDSEQHLTLTARMADGTVLTLPFDITSDMHEFHITDVTEAWVIEIVLQLDIDFKATIEDWKVGPEEWMEAK